MSDFFAARTDRHRHGYAQIGGVRLHYVEKGAERSAGDQLVILLHGFPECWYSWRHQLDALGERYHVVAPDLRGYNLSDKLPRVADYKIEEVASDVLGLIRHFGRERAVIVGHDWGAVIAWAVAARHPGYVEKLAALQVPPPKIWRDNMTLKQALRSWYMLFFQIPRLPEWLIAANNFQSLERSFKRTTFRPGAISDADIAVYKTALREPGALTGAINYYRANARRLFRRGKADEGVSERVRVPTLFIYGERDFAVVPESVRNVGSVIDAPYREVRIATSGHWVQQEAPAEVNAALSAFLETS